MTDVHMTLYINNVHCTCTSINKACNTCKFTNLEVHLSLPVIREYSVSTCTCNNMIQMIHTNNLLSWEDSVPSVSIKRVSLIK